MQVFRCILLFFSLLGLLGGVDAFPEFNQRNILQTIGTLGTLGSLCFYVLKVRNPLVGRPEADPSKLHTQEEDFYPAVSTAHLPLLTAGSTHNFSQYGLLPSATDGTCTFSTEVLGDLSEAIILFPGAPPMVRRTTITADCNGTVIGTRQYVLVTDIPRYFPAAPVVQPSETSTAAAETCYPNISLGDDPPASEPPALTESSSKLFWQRIMEVYQNSKLEVFVDFAGRQLYNFGRLLNQPLSLVLQYLPGENSPMPLILLAFTLGLGIWFRTQRERAKMPARLSHLVSGSPTLESLVGFIRGAQPTEATGLAIKAAPEAGPQADPSIVMPMPVADGEDIRDTMACLVSTLENRNGRVISGHQDDDDQDDNDNDDHDDRGNFVATSEHPFQLNIPANFNINDMLPAKNYDGGRLGNAKRFSEAIMRTLPAPSRANSLITEAPSRANSLLIKAPSRANSLLIKAPSRANSLLIKAPSRSNSVITEAPAPRDVAPANIPLPSSPPPNPPPSTNVTEKLVRFESKRPSSSESTSQESSNSSGFNLKDFKHKQSTSPIRGKFGQHFASKQQNDDRPIPRKLHISSMRRQVPDSRAQKTKEVHSAAPQKKQEEAILAGNNAPETTALAEEVGPEITEDIPKATTSTKKPTQPKKYFSLLDSTLTDIEKSREAAEKRAAERLAAAQCAPEKRVAHHRAAEERAAEERAAEERTAEEHAADPASEAATVTTSDPSEAASQINEQSANVSSDSVPPQHSETEQQNNAEIPDEDQQPLDLTVPPNEDFGISLQNSFDAAIRDQQIAAARRPPPLQVIHSPSSRRTCNSTSNFLRRDPAEDSTFPDGSDDGAEEPDSPCNGKGKTRAEAGLQIRPKTPPSPSSEPTIVVKSPTREEFEREDDFQSVSRVWKWGDQAASPPKLDVIVNHATDLARQHQLSQRFFDRGLYRFDAQTRMTSSSQLPSTHVSAPDPTFAPPEEQLSINQSGNVSSQPAEEGQLEVESKESQRNEASESPALEHSSASEEKSPELEVENPQSDGPSELSGPDGSPHSEEKPRDLEVEQLQVAGANIIPGLGPELAAEEKPAGVEDAQPQAVPVIDISAPEPQLYAEEEPSSSEDAQTQATEVIEPSAAEPSPPPGEKPVENAGEEPQTTQSSDRSAPVLEPPSAEALPGLEIEQPQTIQSSRNFAPINRSDPKWRAKAVEFYRIRLQNARRSVYVEPGMVYRFLDDFGWGNLTNAIVKDVCKLYLGGPAAFMFPADTVDDGEPTGENDVVMDDAPEEDEDDKPDAEKLGKGDQPGPNVADDDDDDGSGGPPPSSGAIFARVASPEKAAEVDSHPRSALRMPGSTLPQQLFRFGEDGPRARVATNFDNSVVESVLPFHFGDPPAAIQQGFAMEGLVATGLPAEAPAPVPLTMGQAVPAVPGLPDEMEGVEEDVLGRGVNIGETGQDEQMDDIVSPQPDVQDEDTAMAQDETIQYNAPSNALQIGVASAQAPETTMTEAPQQPYISQYNVQPPPPVAAQPYISRYNVAPPTEGAQPYSAAFYVAPPPPSAHQQVPMDQMNPSGNNLPATENVAPVTPEGPPRQQKSQDRPIVLEGESPVTINDLVERFGLSSDSTGEELRAAASEIPELQEELNRPVDSSVDSRTVGEALEAKFAEAAARASTFGNGRPKRAAPEDHRSDKEKWGVPDNALKQAYDGPKRKVMQPRQKRSQLQAATAPEPSQEPPVPAELAAALQERHRQKLEAASDSSLQQTATPPAVPELNSYPLDTTAEDDSSSDISSLNSEEMNQIPINLRGPGESVIPNPHQDQDISLEDDPANYTENSSEDEAIKREAERDSRT